MKYKVERKYNSNIHIITVDPKKDTLNLELRKPEAEAVLTFAADRVLPNSQKLSILTVEENGALDLQIYTKEETSSGYHVLNVDKENLAIAFVGHPRIVHQGELRVNTIEEEAAEEVVYAFTAKSGMGYTEDGRLFIVVVDGDGDNQGVTSKQLGQFMLDLGCVEAISIAENTCHIQCKGEDKNTEIPADLYTMILAINKVEEKPAVNEVKEDITVQSGKNNSKKAKQK